MLPTSRLVLPLALLVLGALPASPARAAGLLVDRRSGAALDLVSHRVDVTIDDQIARTRVTQVFRNGSDRVLEATYLFPLPEGAGVSDFAMWIDGDRRPAVIAEREKAVAVYESIVRRKRDPALLEQIGKSRFRMRVYPVLPRTETRIELVYDEALEVSGGVCRYVHPLRLGGGASTVTEDFTVAVRIRSAVPIGAVDSASHAVDVLRTVDGVVVGMEESGATLDDDFVLRYAPAVKELSMSVAAQRAGDGDGTFLVVLNPGEVDEDEVLEKDVLLVMDVSGSMDGLKMQTAVRAMERFVGSLRPGDRFNVLAFGTAVRRFRPGLVPIDDAARAEALAFVRGLNAAGGTAIDAALAAALGDAAAARPDDPDQRRPARVIFVTDGQPTVGERDPRTIIENAVASNRAGVRIFAFGVESDVDGVLLNNLAAKSGGTAERVALGEDLDDVIGELTTRIARPVLADLSVRVEGGGAYDIEPSAPPDLFAGGQVRLVGRYSRPGRVMVTLTGTRRGRAVELEGAFDLPAHARADAPLRRLWAKRRIEFLQDQIWWNEEDGAAGELKDEIVRLSLAERVLTPHTAMLVLETDEDYRRHGLPVPERSQRELAALDASGTPAEDAAGWADGDAIEGRIADAGAGAGPSSLSGGTVPGPRSGSSLPARPGMFGAGPGGPSSPGAGPGAPGGAGGAPRGPVTGAGRGGKKNRPTEGFEQWPFWWEHNRDAVSVRASNHAGSVQSGGAAFLTGMGRRAAPTTSPRPSVDEAVAEIVPVLKEALASVDADVVDSALMALGKVVPASRADLVIDDLVAELSSPHPTVRHAGVLSLGVLGSEEALPILHAMVRDRTVMRLEAAFAAASLGAIGAPESVDVLFETIEREPRDEVDVESMTILALGQFDVRRDEIVAFLAARLDDPSLARTTAAQIPISLARLGSDEARETIPALMRLASGRRTDIRMVESCVLALGRLAGPGDAEVYEFLTETIRGSRIEQARHFAFISLAELARSAARDLARHRERIDEVIAFLSEQLERPRVGRHRPWAALSLALVGRELGEASSRRVGIITTLIEAFEDSNHPSDKAAYATGLGLLDATAVGDMLMAELEEQVRAGMRSSELAGGLARALGLLRHEEAEELLLRLLDESADPRLKIHAATALGRLGSSRAVPALFAQIRGSSPLSVNATCAAALGVAGDRTTIPLLVELVRDESAPGVTRAFACAALGRIAEKTVEPWNTRWAAGTNYRTIVPALYEILDIL